MYSEVIFALSQQLMQFGLCLSCDPLQIRQVMITEHSASREVPGAEGGGKVS